MKYKRGNLDAADVEALREATTRELEALEQAFTEQDFVAFTKTYVQPTKRFDGLTVYADGTSWNPGSGEGVYTYYAAAWHKLG